MDRHFFAAGFLLFGCWPLAISASPYLSAGDTALRNDIQRLADYGVITGPTTTWPLAWGPILADIEAFEIDAPTPVDVVDALARVRARGEQETRSRELFFDARVSAAEKPKRLRSFEDTPRGRGEISAGFTWNDDWFTASVNAQALDVPEDQEALRLDRSVVAASLGSWSVGVSTLERWWGPGWDGSLILSNNARPMPAISIDRQSTDAFQTRWLSWLGPWDLSVQFGRMESDRHIPRAQFFGMRFNFRPLSSLEIGLSRTAQWCGEGRPCDLGVFVDLLVGNDNRGDGEITSDNEPGNQLAGFDFRWTPRPFGLPVAVYGQLIGEDESGYRPSKYLGQFGVETTGVVMNRWSYRGFAEYAGTSCSFFKSSDRFNCAYNHGVYETGYRYRGRSIGHPADNDARVASAGFIAVDANASEWAATLRFGKLNRGGAPDPRNSLTQTGQDIASLDLRHSRSFSFGEISVGAGVERIEDVISGSTDNDLRFFLQWQSSD